MKILKKFVKILIFQSLFFSMLIVIKSNFFKTLNKIAIDGGKKYVDFNIHTDLMAFLHIPKTG